MKLFLSFIFGTLLSAAMSKSMDKDDVYVEPRNEPHSEPIEIKPVDSKDVVPVKIEDVNRLVSTTCNGPAVSAVGTSATNPIVIKSINFPNPYTNNMRCTYTISVPANSQLIISIASLSIECPFDYVQLNVGNVKLSLCPVSANNLFSVSPSTSAYTFTVYFTSDATITYPGFSINAYLNTTSSTPTGPCTCGVWGVRRDGSGRIVGGSIAAPHSVPYQAGIWKQTSGNPFCGGTLISRTHVLTAAHCTKGLLASQLRVALNDVRFTLLGDGEIFINVKTIKNHLGYNNNTQDNDFALLELVSPAPISRTVGIACLPPDVTQTFAGATLTISGWGTTAFKGNQSPDLKVGTVQGLTNTACNSVYGRITANMICAGTPSFKTDTCQGDSGGPLVTSVNGKATLVGVTSFGNGCAKAPFPGVYARVTAQKSWILANSDAGLCQK